MNFYNLTMDYNKIADQVTEFKRFTTSELVDFIDEEWNATWIWKAAAEADPMDEDKAETYESHLETYIAIKNVLDTREGCPQKYLVGFLPR